MKRFSAINWRGLYAGDALRPNLLDVPNADLASSILGCKNPAVFSFSNMHLV